MKKICLVTFVAAALIITISGCTDGRPANVREGVYLLGLEVLAVADEYLDMQITPNEARNRIDRLHNRFNDFADRTDEENSIRAGTNLITISLDLLMMDRRTYEDILERRNNLARYLNKRTR